MSAARTDGDVGEPPDPDSTMGGDQDTGNTEHVQCSQQNPAPSEVPSQECKTGESSPRGLTITIPYWLLGILGVVLTIGFIGVVVDIALESTRPRFSLPPEVMQDLGLDGVILFRQHDRDSNGMLDIIEFEPLAHRLLEINITHQYDLPINATDEVVTIQASFTPLVLSSMSKDLTSRPSGLDPLSGLRRWRSLEQSTMNLSARHFGAWMPEAIGMLDRVGEVYEITEVPEELGQGIPISSNRYVPPQLTAPADMLIHVLLTMFHPRPFIMCRFMPHGSVALVRAVNDRAVDIVFRIHAEFQLNEPPFNPFWFTPGQFTGHLTIDKDGKHVHAFSMHVPNDRKLNVDMEWLTGQNDDQNMEVDIGYLPEMSLNISGPSSPRDQNLDHEGAGMPIEWKEEICLEEALKKLEVHMYPFKKVQYHNVTDAFELADKEDRLVHHILLWGALDDQSC